MDDIRHKLRESSYFLERLRETTLDRDAFNFNLSAFLNAARSVRQFAYERWQNSPGFKVWWNTQITELDRYMKNKRDENIHRNAVVPSAIHTVSVTMSGNSSLRAALTVEHADGCVDGSDHEEASIFEPVVVTPPPQRHDETEYFFRDRPGEEVIGLCARQLTDLTRFATEAEAKFGSSSVALPPPAR